MKQIIALITVLFLSNPMLFAEPELTGSPQELTGYLKDIPQTVRITGKAEKKIPADRAIIHINVKTESRSMADALAANRALRGEITTALLAAGIPTNHIQAAQFSSTPQSGFFSDKIRKYTVENRMKITATNENEFRAVSKLIDAQDEITYGHTEFELSTKKETERLVLAEACRDAVAKKSLYETELSVALTPVKFYDGNVSSRQPQMARMRKMAVADMAFSEGASFAPPPVQFDEMIFNATMNVDYKLEAN